MDAITASMFAAVAIGAVVGSSIIAGILFGAPHKKLGKHKGGRRDLTPQQQAQVEAKIDAEIAQLRPDIREALEQVNITLLVENAVQMSNAKHAMEAALGKNSTGGNPVVLSSADLMVIRYVSDSVEEEEANDYEHVLGNWTESLLLQPGVKALSPEASERFGMPYGMPLIYTENLTLAQMMGGLTQGMALPSP